MKNRYSSLVLVAIVLSMAITVPTDFTQTADAAKAKGIKNNQYGAETKNKVCGDRLCTPDDFAKDGKKKDTILTGQSSISSQIVMSKMERLMELHRTQLSQALESMNDSEKSHMMKMMDKMYEKMKAMNFKDHMKHMSKMMDGNHSMKDGHGMKDGHMMKDKHDMKDRHDKSSCSCEDESMSCGEEGHCSCGEGESMSCGEDGYSCSCN